MNIQTLFTFSSAAVLGGVAFGGLRLLAARQFQGFVNTARIAPPPWRCAFSRVTPVVRLRFLLRVAGSNPAVKLTRQCRAAYFYR